MQYESEPLTVKLTREIDTLLADYYQNTVASEDIPPYDFDWPVYHRAYEHGSLLVVTAREDDETLAGVAIYCISNHPHHRRLCCASCDMISVDHKKRGRGIGSMLLMISIELLKARGVQLINHTYRTVYDTSPMFLRHGFKEWERSYMLRIN